MRYTIDEDLLAKIKLLHIRPSAIILRELRREVRRRERAERSCTKKQIVNRYTGEVLASS
jgi:predicted transcriptional regulator with HTH domain